MIFQKSDRLSFAQSVAFILKFSFINDIIILNKTQTRNQSCLSFLTEQQILPTV